MDVIAPGTLCLLVGDHAYAGHFCTALGFAAAAPCYRPSGQFLGIRPVYSIEMSDGRRTTSGYILGAFRHHLMPVSRPAFRVVTVRAAVLEEAGPA